MGGYFTLLQCGSVIVNQRRNAFNRQSRSHCGSCFFAEMKRTVSSLRPGGNVSASMSVVKPYWYSRLTSDSIDELMPAPLSTPELFHALHALHALQLLHAL